MAVKIRLKKMGAKQKPFYRIVVADSKFSRDGRFIEKIGIYNPITVPHTVEIDEEAAIKWLNNGAQPTDTVRSLLSNAGVLKKFAEQKTTKDVKTKSKKTTKKDGE